MPVANNMVAALANTAIDYPGSCGRCGMKLPSLVQPAMCQSLVRLACAGVAQVHLPAPTQHALPSTYAALPFVSLVPLHSTTGLSSSGGLLPGGALQCCRCYEVRCQNGLVIANYTGPASNPTSAAELQTIAQGYVPTENVSAVTDTFGRTAPVNPLLSKNLIYTNCWNNTLVRAGCPSRCIIMAAALPVAFCFPSCFC